MDLRTESVAGVSGVAAGERSIMWITPMELKRVSEELCHSAAEECKTLVLYSGQQHSSQAQALKLCITLCQLLWTRLEI